MRNTAFCVSALTWMVQPAHVSMLRVQLSVWRFLRLRARPAHRAVYSRPRGVWLPVVPSALPAPTASTRRKLAQESWMVCALHALSRGFNLQVVPGQLQVVPQHSVQHAARASQAVSCHSHVQVRRTLCVRPAQRVAINHRTASPVKRVPFAVAARRASSCLLFAPLKPTHSASPAQRDSIRVIPFLPVRRAHRAQAALPANILM